ncbi:cyclin-like protein 8 [Elsinoe australis]|uniref:Cyclin-like protein 8 n=1 Tax=Elsinoe australis TaxID=40998 RepID=A0A4U7ALH4_9PEZI|nr:cyclin-like protein 8 [Elsinoe australis]
MDVCVFDPSHGGYVSVQSQQKQDHVTISRSPSPSTSNDDVFSITSEQSSQSSHGDSDEESYQAFERKVTCAEQSQPSCEFTKPDIPTQSFCQTSAVQHQHPRRSISAATRPPPLPRQDERKVLFVNDLVDSATNLVSVIWPLSGSPTARDCNNRGVLPLRKYIEETLRRSRTSYSTLQVALYYLILIKDHVPRHDFTMEQPADCAALRAMQCGRRMFLAALILASKYLQDRNYSAKAWSKMSGLKTTEINCNERLFLSAVCWKLHIPDHIFKRWTDIVLRFTAPPSPPSPGVSVTYDSKNLWAQVIPLLTPELDDPRVLGLPMDSFNAAAFPSPVATPSPTPILATFPSIAISRTNTPSPNNVAPRFLGPKSEVLPPTPGLARQGPLPTPQMTPSSIAASTPAVSTCSSRRPSISMAMAQANVNMLCRITSDRLAGAALPQRPSSTRYPSVAPSTVSWSSPESMISDVTRSSRSSSISSVSTSNSAPTRAQRGQASSRFGSATVINLDSSSTKKELFGTADQPIPILDDSEITASPDVTHFTIRADGTIAPTNPITPLKTRESRKRCRSRPTSTTDSELQEEVRALLAQQSVDAMDIDSDPKTASQRVPTCALRRAFANMRSACPFSATKAVQPPAMLRRGSGARVPVANGEGNKRVCSTTTAVPDVYMEVNGGVWQGLP